MKRRNFLATAGAIISTGGSISLIGDNANAKFNFGLENQSKFTTADISSDNLIVTFSNISLDYDNFKTLNKDIKIQVYAIVNNKDNILIDGVSNGVIRDYEIDFDWQNEEVFVSVDGNSGTFSFVNSPTDTDFQFEFTADADRWDFLRRYDDIKFEY